MELTEPLPPVWADVDRLRYILINLMDNAVKFTEAGEVVMSAEANAENVLIHVRDTGPGVSEGQRRYLFEPFQHALADSAPEGASGTGLGLPVSRLLAMRHGGDLLVRTAVGKGSTFTLQLPRRPAGTPPPPEK
jgi:signal transduction histidine kinase